MLDRFMLLSLVAVLFSSACLTCAAEDKRKQPKTEPTEELLSKLFEQEIQFETDVKSYTLKKLLSELGKKYEIAFDVGTFAGDEDLEIDPLVLESRFRRFSLHQFLEHVLSSYGRTYRIKGNRVQIVFAPEIPTPDETYVLGGRWVKIEPDDDRFDPVTSFIVRGKPLKEAVELLATRYEINVTFASQANKAFKEPVSGRLINIAAGRSLEMLAMQCGLCVVRKGGDFLITTREHIREMADDEVKIVRRKFEVAKLRNIINSGFIDTTQTSQVPEPPTNPDSQKKANEKK